MRQIPMLDLKLEYEYMKNDIDTAIAACLDHQRWILGPEVRELEEKLAEYLGVKNCIGVSSGTEALVLSLRAIAIAKTGDEYFKVSDEIITTPFTFTATGDAILRSGATPVFVDIDPATFNISPDAINRYLNEHGEKVKGIIPVHLYGLSCQMDEIREIADKHGLFIVEDVAQAIGASWKGDRVGSLGTAGAFSFFPSKNLGGFGDGGMISTNDSEVAELVRMLLKHGGRDKYNVDHVGYNARLDTLQAAIVQAKLKHLDEFNDRRRDIAKKYTDELRGSKELVLPDEVEGAHHVFHQFTLRAINRDGLKDHLASRGISSMIYYPIPLHKMRVFDGRCKTTSVSGAENACEQVLSLPVEPLQSKEDTQRVIDGVKTFINGSVS